ncbi:hypothetical protein E4W45_17755 [Klebsiella pneumoniae]|uniref:hypothetical protein n=1 Tax=Klebsiella/Raoultella group TaxID=2890311 RepID=UPI0013EF5D46|nr:MULTISPECIES: hypothetical protein [Klebsiella/Raoultella group]MBA0010897.1 hypothetical protein [Klebsiella pneumoniae]MBA0024583.1 hypothetical protein [Klebsiella pneumoniae]MBA0081767.1 hypothetical protein [Klebsiella pneumoniae]MBA0096170.1 hypothetical protein [Klebsiella pneumoniae]MCH0759190.1 hypothetical protein [Klebsiella pneumoniae]
MEKNKSGETPGFKQFENIDILLSHRECYGNPKTPEKIIGDNVSLETLSQLSILSCVSNEERKFREWSKTNIPACKGNAIDERRIYGRAQIIVCWKLMLISANNSNLLIENNADPTHSLSILHELLTHINDYNISEDVHQYVIKSAIIRSRDDFKFKMYRAYKIFIEGANISQYVQLFQEKSGFSIESYINIIYMIICRYIVKRSSVRFDIMLCSDWIIDLRKASQETGIKLQLLINVMKSVSFDLKEGADFSASTINEPTNCDIFRNKPFLRLSETEYLPIEGRFIEELLFDNLFHKIHLYSGKTKGFLDDFGADFELYVQYICKESCALERTGLYEYIPEFSYGKSNSKSPDAMILCSKNKTLLAFEVKAARYLDSILSSENNSNAIEKSFNKLKYNPWKQAHTAIHRIVLEGRHPKIIEGLSCMFVSITMNEIPLSLHDHKITIGDRDISYCFYSLGLHTFELLLSVITQKHDYTAYDILRNAYEQRHKISTKTYLLRFYRNQSNTSNLDHKVAQFISVRHRKFMESCKYSTQVDLDL